MKKSIITIIIIASILCGCATTKDTVNEKDEKTYQTDKEFVAEITKNFTDSFNTVSNPTIQIIYCEKIEEVYKDFLNKYSEKMSVEETAHLKNRIFKLQQKTNEITNTLIQLIALEKENLNYNRFQYEKIKAINDLKFINKVIKDENKKRFNIMGIRVNIKNAARSWKLCERVMKGKYVPEVLKMKAGDHKIALMKLMRAKQEKICENYLNFKGYSQYKDYPNWDVLKAAILKYMNEQKIEKPENDKLKNIKIVSINK